MKKNILNGFTEASVKQGEFQPADQYKFIFHSKKAGNP